jgi:hypothetical protein
MDVFIDNDPAQLTGANLGDLIASARAKLETTSRIIVEVRVDGRTLSAEEFDALTDSQPAAEEVQFITADPYSLATVTLGEVRDALTTARQAQQQAAELLQSDNAAQAMDHIRHALAVWQQAQQALLQSAQLLDVPLDDLTVADRPMAELVDELGELLNQVREQLTAGDFLGLADTLAYPLTDALDTWAALIDAMCGKIEEKR